MAAGIKLELNKREAKELTEYLDGMRKNSVDPRPVFEYFVSVSANSAIENFREQGRSPHKWAELAESTIAAREARGTWPGNILEEYGPLKQSLLPGASGGFKKITRESGEYGTVDERAPWLQNGTNRIPPRPFLYFRDDDIRKIMAYAFMFAFQPDIAKRYGRAPKVGNVPNNLFLGVG